MYGVHVTLKVKAGLMGKFLPAMRTNAKTSLAKEPGCLQFDVFGVDDDPDVVVLFELYQRKSDFAAHLNTSHFLAFDAEVSDMIEGKTVRAGDRLFPEG